jgi:hypothetical protein
MTLVGRREHVEVHAQDERRVDRTKTFQVLRIDDESCCRPNYSVSFPSESARAFHDRLSINIYLLQKRTKISNEVKGVYVTSV